MTPEGKDTVMGRITEALGPEAERVFRIPIKENCHE
jgi:hypothetical protein